MLQADITQEHVQGFRSVHKSQPPSTISVPLNSPEVVHIDCYTDPDTNKDFVLWEDIQQAFNEALYVRSRAKMLPFAKGKDLRASNAATEGGHQSKTVTKNMLNPQDYEAAANMGLMKTMACADQGDVQAQNETTKRRWIGIPKLPIKVIRVPGSTSDSCMSKDKMAFLRTMPKPSSGSLSLPSRVMWMPKQKYLRRTPTDGASVPKDNIEAMEWLVRAAENGHAVTQYNMGSAYEKGQGVPQSNSRSFEWYLKSADQGFAEAQARVANAFEDGWGVSQDDAKAIEWYTKAAYQGLAVAQYALGRVHRLGLCGFPKDLSRAADWYLKAAVQGHTESQS
ncbi:hypothetical protein BGZ88_005885, partial [Linnemannia elongata]